MNLEVHPIVLHISAVLDVDYARTSTYALSVCRARARRCARCAQLYCPQCTVRHRRECYPG
eukprot:5824566-Karenia_brevis.AAC.1